MTLQVTIEGPAPTQGSHRAVVRGSRAWVIHDSRRLAPWRARAVAAMRRVAPPAPFEGPVAVEITVFAARPLAHYLGRRRECGLREDAPRLPAVGRDLDKVARAILDACTQAGWWRDDRQVAALVVDRAYAESLGPGDVERVEVCARSLCERGDGGVGG